MSVEAQQERRMEAEAALEKVLNEFSDVLGPSKCTVHDDMSDPEVCGPETCVAMAVPAFASEYVVCMAWTTMEDGENLITDFAPSRSLITHNLGLLRASQVLMEKDF